jgi:uncharacterized protein YjgD (DUF1641 family)
MEIPEENLTSLEFLLKNLSSMIYIPMNKLKETNDIIKKAKEKHYNEVNDAFLKGMKHGGELKSTEPNPF